MDMFPSSALVGQNKEESIAALPIDDLIEKSTITRSRLQARKHICVMTGGGVNDDPALKKAGIGIAVADANGAARSASDIILTEPGPSVIISAVLTSQAISQRMTNYTVNLDYFTYAIQSKLDQRCCLIKPFDLLHFHRYMQSPLQSISCSISLHSWSLVLTSLLLSLIMALIDSTIMTISKDRMKPSPQLDSWKLAAIFTTGVILGGYSAMMTVIFFWAAYKKDFFPEFGGWGGVIWLYNLLFYFPLHCIKFFIRYALIGKAWDLLLNKGLLSRGRKT
ncbi:hypothetical protein V6N11_018736 [Hibiscus sabdariffa]|uniref:Uncharacterized protein n=1 Tax=Hibiscus sabdariffa TaxID=183260 RepID=A0ABR2QT40_9ROSI